MASNKNKQRANQEVFQESVQIINNRNNNRKFKFTRQQFDSINIQLSIRQQEYYKTIRNNILTVCQGPAGSSKTYTACYAALVLLADKKIERIILTKPLMTSGEDIGYLPGSLQDKVNPFMMSYFSTFEKLIGKPTFEFLISMGDIQVETLAYMRGTTFDDCIMLLDECQNITMTQLMLWITRLGNNSRGIMMGDISQYDIKKKDSKFLEFIKFLDGVDGISHFKFETSDIVRNKFLIDVVNRYEKWKSDNPNL